LSVLCRGGTYESTMRLRQLHLDSCPLAGPTLDGERTAVAGDDVLDDGEPETGPLLAAARLRVDAVKALGEAGDVRLFDAHAIVGDRDQEPPLARGQRHVHLAALGAVFDGVVDEVFEYL